MGYFGRSTMQLAGELGECFNVMNGGDAFDTESMEGSTGNRSMDHIITYRSGASYLFIAYDASEACDVCQISSSPLFFERAYHS